MKADSSVILSISNIEYLRFTLCRSTSINTTALHILKATHVYSLPFAVQGPGMDSTTNCIEVHIGVL